MSYNVILWYHLQCLLHYTATYPTVDVARLSNFQMGVLEELSPPKIMCNELVYDYVYGYNVHTKDHFILQACFVYHTSYTLQELQWI